MRKTCLLSLFSFCHACFLTHLPLLCGEPEFVNFVRVFEEEGDWSRLISSNYRSTKVNEVLLIDLSSPYRYSANDCETYILATLWFTWKYCSQEKEVHNAMALSSPAPDPMSLFWCVQQFPFSRSYTWISTRIDGGGDDFEELEAICQADASLQRFG